MISRRNHARSRLAPSGCSRFHWRLRRRCSTIASARLRLVSASVRGLAPAAVCAASTLRAASIARAPIAKAEGLKAIKFRGQMPIDPRSQDFFKVVIEERMRLAARTDLSDAERERLRRSLKTLGSATSYGIFAQTDRRESDKEVALTCYGIIPTPHRCKVKHPEAPGEYCFPPLASLSPLTRPRLLTSR